MSSKYSAERLHRVRQRIAAAATAVGRDARDIHLLAVSKQQPVAAVRALAQAGQRAFGENTLPGAHRRMADLAALALEWHFIGRIQKNKTRPIAAHFAWVHSLERDAIATRLGEQRPAHLPPLQVCIQVNVSDEPTKGGVPPAAVAALARHVSTLPRLQLRGLMTIPRRGEGAVGFARLRRAYDELKASGLALDTLSMGMSADLEQAVAAGATLLRIGTDLFGPRDPRHDRPAEPEA